MSGVPGLQTGDIFDILVHLRHIIKAITNKDIKRNIIKAKAISEKYEKEKHCKKIKEKNRDDGRDNKTAYCLCPFFYLYAEFIHDKRR